MNKNCNIRQISNGFLVEMNSWSDEVPGNGGSHIQAFATTPEEAAALAVAFLSFETE